MNVVLDTSIISIAATIIVGAFGFMYKFIRDIIKDLNVLKKDLEGKIAEVDKTADNKVSNVYKRFDEYKLQSDSKFVLRSNCDILHASTRDNLNGLEKRLSDSFDKLELKVDANFKTFIEQITKLFQNGNKQPA